MRRAVCVGALLGACAIFAAPAAAQTGETGWFVNTSIGPSFGTFGSQPSFDADAGYRFTDLFAISGEFGVLPHAPFDKAAPVSPAISLPEAAVDPDIHVNGYHVNANLWMTPRPWGRISPYLTGGIGTFSARTVARFGLGPVSTKRYEAETNLATNVGAGLMYRVNRWFGVGADYRHFLVDAVDVQHLNRFTAGVSFFVR
jgi:opacity protein-like surface antigen